MERNIEKKRKERGERGKEKERRAKTNFAELKRSTEGKVKGKNRKQER